MKKLFLGFMLVSNIFIVHASNSIATNLSVDFVVVDPCVDAAIEFADTHGIPGNSSSWSYNYSVALCTCNSNAGGCNF